MPVSRRNFLKQTSYVMAGATLAACAPAGGPAIQGEGADGTASGEKVSVTYLIRSDIGVKMQEWTDVALAEFHEKNSDIEVATTGVPWGDYNTKLLALFATGTPPEVSANYAAGFPTFYANDAHSFSPSHLPV